MKESTFLPKPRKPIPEAFKNLVLKDVVNRLKMSLTDLEFQKNMLEARMTCNTGGEFGIIKNLFLWFRMLSLKKEISKTHRRIHNPESVLHEHNKICHYYEYIEHAKIQHI